ncbi:ArnT family glycosyltransferase [Sphingomonas sp. XXL09]|uniref:ArnT family glycosyltransferase n=1 Tax=Sphingomonas sp. XXL09 TaxID=3457787 RepID=UPI00406BC77B
MTLRRAWLILCLAAVALRLPDIGNPLIDYDEQMYLLVARRMWDGAWPYVDIWDRKPIGLFLIYAGSQAFGGDPIVAYHLLALLCVGGTAMLIATWLTRIASPWCGLVGGLVYILWIGSLGGRGGQAPVYYEPLVAAAAWAAWRAASGGRRGWTAAAMLLAGVALQIKPTVVFEGCFFGAAILFGDWRRGRALLALAGEAAAMIALALAPTLLAYGVYAVCGHGQAWWFANVDSIFLRGITPSDPVGGRVINTAAIVAIPLAVALYGIARHAGPMRPFLAGWLAAALLGWLAIPPYLVHYAMPLMLPIALGAGLAVRRSWAPAALLAIPAGWFLWLSGYPHRGETAMARRAVVASARLIDRYRGRGCAYIFLGPPAFYTASGSCLPTRYPFSEHLGNISERGAIGIDPQVEVARILASRPPVIVSRRSGSGDNPATVALVRTAVRSHYRRVGTTLGYAVYARTN